MKGRDDSYWTSIACKEDIAMVEGSEQGSEVKVGFKSVLVSLPGYPVLVTNNLKKNLDAHR